MLNGDVSHNSESGGENGKRTASIIAMEAVHNDQPVFRAEPAYKQFMSAFFPGPNILLQDGPRHTASKERWKQRMRETVSETSGLKALISKLTKERFVEPLVRSAASTSRDTTFDLYDAMKSLSWDLLFGIFLDLNREQDRSEFGRMEALQEDLLRGQFSLFPVSVRTPFWSSPRTKGLNAVKSLQELLRRRVDHLDRPETSRSSTACPFKRQAHGRKANEQSFDEDDMVAHLLIFTSSIANKALASLLTAYMMNLFLWRDDGPQTSNLAQLIRSQEVETTKVRMLQSILSETERLSPPVVGVMRRVKQDIVLFRSENWLGAEQSEYPISNGHDAWLYLAGASRDPTAFADADRFVWDRYMSSSDEKQDHGFAFGGGVKSCLGKKLAQQTCLNIAKTILDSGLLLNGIVTEQGVKHWLGWEKNVPLETIAKDLKQLPCQRPRRPVNVVAIMAR